VLELPPELGVEPELENVMLGEEEAAEMLGGRSEAPPLENPMLWEPVGNAVNVPTTPEPVAVGEMEETSMEETGRPEVSHAFVYWSTMLCPCPANVPPEPPPTPTIQSTQAAICCATLSTQRQLKSSHVLIVVTIGEQVTSHWAGMSDGPSPPS